MNIEAFATKLLEDAMPGYKISDVNLIITPKEETDVPVGDRNVTSPTH